MAKTIGIDVGGTNLRIGVFEKTVLLQEERFQADFSNLCQQYSPQQAWQMILDSMTDSIQAVLKQYTEITSIGIGFPGFIDPVSQVIAQSPNLPGLIHVDLANELSRRIDKTVVVTNDANAAAYGEYCLLNKPDGGLIYLGLGTGVGGGLVLQHQPYIGQHGCAMEVGHIIVKPLGRPCGCGNLGCMEQYASASGVALSYFEATQQQFSAYDIAQRAYANDEYAIQAYQLAADSLAQALASMLKIVDVSNVVIGGGMVAAWDLMEVTFQQRLQQDLIPVLRDKIKVHISTAQDNAGMLGAAMLAVD